MSTKFLFEREGQIKFFADFNIAADVELTHNTDGVYRGTLFEFKLTISDINKALFQAIKYLSHRRIKGEPVPAQILLVALNEEIVYLFHSGDFLKDIEIIYAGAASKNNADFSTKIKPEKVDYSKQQGLDRITKILDVEYYTKVHIDVFDVVGWANKFYLENPTASKIKLFKELKDPKFFSPYIYPWLGNEKDFKYIMDLLNDKQHKKELGAFYTPPAYCHKATELVRKAIKQIPMGHDYIILDRCAGTGNLQEFLTDKPVNDIIISELSRYIEKTLKKKYLQDKKDIIDTFYSKRNFNEITIGELEKHKTRLSLHDYIFDDELSHTIVNTYELKEWIVLNERIGDRVKLIIPPPQEVSNKEALVEGGDALSSQFVTGQQSLKMTKQYHESIAMLLGYVKDKKTNVILYENPPYRDETSNTHLASRGKGKNIIKEEMAAEKRWGATQNDMANQFIFAAWKHYLTKPNDAYVLFSPVKYWKSLGLGEYSFIDGFLFNRAHFHAGPSAISCILWLNKPDSKELLTLKAFDIDKKDTPEQEDDEVVYLQSIKVKKVHESLKPYFDKRKFDDDIKSSIVVELSGYESVKKFSKIPIYNKNIVGHIRITSYNLDPISMSLTRVITHNGLVKTIGFYLREDNYIDKLPLFAAKLYPQKNWYERDVYFTTADGGERYLKDRDFLKTCFIFACLSQRNHCRSFKGSDGRFYKNELCFDEGTKASVRLKSYKLTTDEQDLLDTFNDVLEKARATKNYDKKSTYGTYQIDEELNTRYKNDNEEWIYDDPELNTAVNSLKTKLAKYYEAVIQPKLFEYELLK